jgi:hypothetical protein
VVARRGLDGLNLWRIDEALRQGDAKSFGLMAQGT